MALGGGIFTAQNKILPGSYINFVSAGQAGAALSDRGVAAMPLQMDWGEENDIFTVTSEQFAKDSMKLFGYPYAADELKGLRDLFQNIRIGYFYRLNGGGTKAANTYCTAKYSGTRGNSVQTVIQENENSEEQSKLYDVATWFDGTLVDMQRAVASASDLVDNDYCVWKTDATLAVTAGTACTGGTNGTAQNEAYQTFLDKLESYSFNVVGTTSTDSTVKSLFANWTKRMRDEVGIKFQCVLYQYTAADYEGVISVENSVTGSEASGIVYWVTGAEAGCALNKSLTNATYTGEYIVNTDYTQTELENGMQSGKLMLHQVGDTVRILEDINTLVTFKEEKSADFSSNQTIRVIDQVGNDIAALFNTKYLGKIPNDNAGRISLWNDIVKHHQELEEIGAIENFDPELVTVAAGENKKSVTVTDYITPTQCLSQLYMTVIVN